MLKYKHIPYLLDFKFDAGTSRGVLKQKETHFIKLWDENNPEVYGIGEAGMFRGLSVDDRPSFVDELNQVIDNYTAGSINILDNLQNNPSIATALEMALLDLKNGGKREIYRNDFSRNNIPLPINGLIWMGEKDFMKKQIIEKIDLGFDCIKLKIGALDFNYECELIKFIREEYTKDLIVRVDANGAFDPLLALGKLQKLSKYNLHSIEQPIRANQWEEMAALCDKTPLPIALDEELIGVSERAVKERLLDIIKPQYIILKPSLLGGFENSEEWIQLADDREIGWWVTSALESNIGLNAITQWTSQLLFKGHQGLGTGALYANNIKAPLYVKNGMIAYDKNIDWDLKLFE
jgi:o-succinylbenzoate synthase